MRTSTNNFKIEGDELRITTKQGDVIYADAEDYERLKRHSWCISKTGYAVANINHRVIKMHRFLLNLVDANDVIDHKNHNKLDNRKANLRRCTQLQNSKNVQKHRGSLELGVRLTPSGKFSARIMVNRREVFLGNFDTLEEAVNARIKAEQKYCGEFGYHHSVENENKEVAEG